MSGQPKTTPATEPVLTAAVVTVVTSALAVAIAFGLSVTPEQSALLVGLVTAVASLVTAVLARRRTVPMGPVQPPEH